MITLNAVGDLMLAGKVEESISKKGADYLFDKVRDILSEADFTIGNLECPLSDRGTPNMSSEKQFIFRSSPEFVRSLKNSGFNILCLANNHILDYGPIALHDTINYLKNHDIYHIGAGNNLSEACKPIILEKNGLKISFLAFTYAYRAKKNKPGCCPCDQVFIKKQVKSLKNISDLVVVSIHHGVEYVDYPNRYIISLFRGAADAGADLVLGHHPHVVQGIELYSGSLIAYSLGNFISSYSDKEERRISYQKTALSYFTNHPPAIDDMKTIESFILQCKMNHKGINDYKIIPVKSNDEFQPELMNGNDAELFLYRLKKISDKLSHLNDSIWDEMDELWEKCKIHGLRKYNFFEIIRNLHHLRFRHLKLALPYLKAKLIR